MIFVTLGTHGQPFTHALAIISPLAGADDILVQHGATPPDPALTGVRWVDYLDWPALSEQLDAADVVICHAGVGSAISALRHGKRPIMLARRADRGEHVDDHQFQLATRFQRAGWAFVADDASEIEALVGRARAATGSVPLTGDGRLSRAIAGAARGPA